MSLEGDFMKYGQFEKGSVVFMAVMFVMSMASAAFAQGNVDSPDMTEDIADVVSSVRAQPVRSDAPAVMSTDVRMDNCVGFLSNNNLDDNPGITCARILKREMNCIEFLKRKGVDDAVAKCDNMFLGARIAAVNRVTAQNMGVDVAARRAVILKRMDKASPQLSQFISEIPDDKVDVFARLPRAEQKKILEMDADERMNRINDYEVRPVKKTMLFKKREIAKSNVDAAKQRFEQAKNDYEKVNYAYKERKKLFLQTKEKLKECEALETDECNELRAQVQAHAKEYIINGAKMAIEHLNKIKGKVEAEEGMDEESAAEIIADIDEAISDLEDAIEKVDKAETKEEVQEGAADVAKAWKRIKHAEKVHAAKVVHAGTWNIIKKSEQLEKRLDDALAKMEERSIVVDDIDAKVDLFSEKVNDALLKFNEAEELILKAQDMKTDNPTDEEIEAVKALADEARELLRDAHQDIKDAYKMLAEILRDIYSAGGKMSSGTAAEEGLASDEVYEVVDTADEGSGEDDSETADGDESLPPPSATEDEDSSNASAENKTDGTNKEGDAL